MLIFLRGTSTCECGISWLWKIFESKVLSRGNNNDICGAYEAIEMEIYEIHTFIKLGYQIESER